MSLLSGKQIALGSNGVKAVNVDTTEIPTLAGTSTFTGTVSVPTPSASGNAANKSYVDTAAANAVAVPATSNKNMAASTTTDDGDLATASSIAATPASDGYVSVRVNGVDVGLADGDGQRATSMSYFSGDGGTTARNISDIVSGDLLYWNGSVAGYQLSASSDVLDFDYDVTTGIGSAGYSVTELSGPTVTPSAGSDSTFDTILTANTTLALPSGMTNGQSIVVRFAQDATGGWTLTFNAGYKFPSGIVPTNTPTANAVDLLTVVKISNNYYATMILDVK